MSELITYFVLILTLWGGVIPANADLMEGGTDITKNSALYSFTAKIGDKSSGSPCLGVIVSSLISYTSAYCHVKPKVYTVQSSVGDSGTAVMDVKSGVTMNDWAMIVSTFPGVIMETNSSVPGPHISQFSTEVIEAGMTLVVFAYENNKMFKACVVKSMTISDYPTCDDMYTVVQKMNAAAMMPMNRTTGLVCALGATPNVTVELEMFNAKQTISGGMPCESSIGAPVVANQLVIGIVVYASCKNNSRVVLIQPAVRGIRRDVIWSPGPSTAYTWHPYTGTHITITGLSERAKPRMSTTAKSRAIVLGPKHPMVWTAVAACTIICAI